MNDSSITTLNFWQKHRFNDWGFWLILVLLLVLNRAFNETFYAFFYDGASANLFNKINPAWELSAESIYGQFSFLLANLGNIFFLIPMGLLGVFFWRYRKSLTWKSFDHYKPLRLFIVFVCAFMVWFFTTYEYNFWYGQAHYLDRFIILLVGVLVWYRPVFIPLFAAVCLITFAQFQYPIGEGSINDKRIVFDLLFLFSGVLLLKPFFQIKSAQVFFLLMIVIAANYFVPILGKIAISPQWINWTLEDELWIHFAFAHERGWLSTADPSTIETMGGFYKTFNVFMLITTTIIEGISLLVLWKRKWSVLIFLGFNVFHLVVFAESGIFFWKWILFNFMIAGILWKADKKWLEQVFTTRNFVVSIVLIVLSLFLFNPVQLSWWDLRYNAAFEYEVVTEDGNTYRIAGNQIGPYQQPLSFKRFHFLVPDSIVHVRPGNLDYSLVEELKALDYPEFRKEAPKWDVNLYHQGQTDNVTHLLEKYIAHHNETYTSTFVPSLLQGPDHIYTGNYIPQQFVENQPIRELVIYYIQRFHDGEQIHEYRKDKVLTVKAPNTEQN